MKENPSSTPLNRSSPADTEDILAECHGNHSSGYSEKCRMKEPINNRETAWAEIFKVGLNYELFNSHKGP